MKKLSIEEKKEVVAGLRCGTCGLNWSSCNQKGAKIIHKSKTNHICQVAP